MGILHFDLFYQYCLDSKFFSFISHYNIISHNNIHTTWEVDNMEREIKSKAIKQPRSPAQRGW